MGLFGWRKKEDRSVEALLAEANAASPTGAAGAVTTPADAPTAPTGDGSFRMPVADVFFIQGRGTVVTGRVESGLAQVGLQVNVVRDGGVAFTTKITGIEMFRKVMDTAKPGDNVGLLLADLTREQLHTGDVIQG
jgi:translation elongation factor EF-Tu-like GTPase